MRHPIRFFTACALSALMPLAAGASSSSSSSSSDEENPVPGAIQSIVDQVSKTIPTLISAPGARSASPSGDMAGGAGQGQTSPIGVWGNVTGGLISDDTASVNSDGSLYVGTVGVDYMATAELLVGAALSLDMVDVDFTPQGATGAYEQTAFTFSPYLAYQINEMFSVTAAAGYSIGSADISATVGGQAITAEADTQRRFLSISGAANTAFGNITVGGDATLLYVYSKTDEYTASNGAVVSEEDSDTVQMSVGTRVGYLVGLSDLTLEPFATLGYAYDIARQDSTAAGHPNDKSELRLGGGLALYSTDYGVGAFEVQTKFRENVNDTTFGLTYRYQF